MDGKKTHPKWFKLYPLPLFHSILNVRSSDISSIQGYDVSLQFRFQSVTKSTTSLLTMKKTWRTFRGRPLGDILLFLRPLLVRETRPYLSPYNCIPLKRTADAVKSFDSKWPNDTSVRLSQSPTPPTLRHHTCTPLRIPHQARPWEVIALIPAPSLTSCLIHHNYQIYSAPWPGARVQERQDIKISLARMIISSKHRSPALLIFYKERVQTSFH